MLRLHVGLEAAFSEEARLANVTLKRLLLEVLLPMVQQVALRGEALATAYELALKGLLASVDSHVSLQVAVFSEPAATDSTLEWFLTSVSSDVDLKPSTPGIPLTADVATERLLSSVDQHVSLQVAFGDETLSTALPSALEWPVVGMSSQVRLQIASFSEVLETKREAAEQ